LLDINVLIADIAVILIASALLGALAQWCGQPRVVGQIIAGILLGPTLLGHFPGHLTARLFPHSVLPTLNGLAQVAVVLFMFVVGYELDLRRLQGRRRAVPMIALSALIIPMGLGIGATLAFHSEFVGLGEPHHLRPSFVLFMAVALSITALPVLAAIVRERGIAGTTAGTTATAAAGLMDVAAWLALAAALVSATSKHGRPWWETALLLIGFVAVMLLVIRPALRWWMTHRRSPMGGQLLVAMVLALGGAWVTGLLGLHPVFGGLLAGFTMPSADGTPDPEILRPMEEVGGLLLPLFFVVTGLSLNVGAMGGTAAVVFVIVCVVASVGKLGPGYVASRIGGLGREDSATVAALVNTRGLTELIALNVGLSAGLIDKRLFTVLVLMAVLMTLATGPLLSLIRKNAGKSQAPEPQPVAGTSQSGS
jgi:Kef-type K+ transport system membrane component KefB